MKSPKILNYETRPCKFTERRMLLASFMRIIGVLKQEYQYKGFGGLAFTDFKLFHKELHINQMHSIEACYSKEKIEFNKPYSFITIEHNRSTNILSQIDLKKPTIIWLDYDDTLSYTIFMDLQKVLQELPHGSIYVMSCNRELKNENNETCSVEELRERFGHVVPFHLQKDCCADINVANTIKQMMEIKCKEIINERNKLAQETVFFKTLYNIKYAEYRGARMYTFGGIVLKDSDKEMNLNLSEFDFISTDTPYEINIPNLTHVETNYLNKILNIEEKEQQLVKKDILSADDIEKYKKFYKYLPNFYDVRI